MPIQFVAALELVVEEREILAEDEPVLRRQEGAGAGKLRTAIVIDSLCTSIPKEIVEAAVEDDMSWSLW